MENKLYVGNLSYSSTQADLEQLFGQYGNVTNVNVVTDKYSGRPRGFAFVEMESADAAQEAIQALHDTEFQTRKLVVNVAKPPSKGPGGGGGGRRRSGGGGGGRRPHRDY